MDKQCLVIKCGGSTLTQLPDSFFADMRQLQEQGIIPIIVHGGGPAINETLQRLNIESTFVANGDEIGFVGDVIGVNAQLILGLVGMGYIPVIAPLGIGADGEASERHKSLARMRKYNGWRRFLPSDSYDRFNEKDDLREARSEWCGSAYCWCCQRIGHDSPEYGDDAWVHYHGRTD